MKKKILVACVLSAFAVANVMAPVARADEPQVRGKTVFEGDRGGRRGGGGSNRGGGHGGGHGGGRHRSSGGSGWGWAAFGTVLGLGILDAVTSNKSEPVYVQQAPVYVQPAAPTYYYAQPVQTYQYQYQYVQPQAQGQYVQPRSVQPAPGAYLPPPPACCP